MDLGHLYYGRPGGGEPVKPLGRRQKSDLATFRTALADLHDGIEVLLQDVQVDVGRGNRLDLFPVQHVTGPEKTCCPTVQDDPDVPEDTELNARDDPNEGLVVIVPDHG